MKQGWKITVFDDCINKVKVTTKLPTSSYKKEGTYPIVSQEKELISGYWDNAEDVIHSDIPLTIFGDHTMVVKYVDFDFVVGADGVKILQPKTFLLPKFFYYWVKSVDIPSRGYARHYRYLRENNVPIPTIAEQERIVEILDREFEKIDALKANAERSLQQAKDLFQSALKQELQTKEGWKTKTINELSEQLFAGGDVPKNAMSKTKTEEYDVPIYANAVENNGLYGYTNIARVYTPSITIAGRGSGTGYVIERTEPYLPVVRLIVIVPQESEVKNRFLYYALKSLNIKSNGSAIPQLTVPMIAQYSINYPKIELQDYIIKKLDILNEHCKAVEENYTKTMALCDDMKQALLRQAFNGEL